VGRLKAASIGVSWLPLKPVMKLPSWRWREQLNCLVNHASAASPKNTFLGSDDLM